MLSPKELKKKFDSEPRPFKYQGPWLMSECEGYEWPEMLDEEPWMFGRHTVKAHQRWGIYQRSIKEVK